MRKKSERYKTTLGSVRVSEQMTKSIEDYCKQHDITKSDFIREVLYSALDSDSLRFYEFLQDRGYTGSLGQFLNETIQAYLKNQGLSIALVTESSQSQKA